MSAVTRLLLQSQLKVAESYAQLGLKAAKEMLEQNAIDPELYERVEAFAVQASTLLERLEKAKWLA